VQYQSGVWIQAINLHCAQCYFCCVTGLQESVKPLSVAERLIIAGDAARGLTYLHSEKCLIHMDVKR